MQLNKLNIVRLVVSIAVCQMAGVAGAIFVTPSLPWYNTLEKPWFAPPGSVISVIWIVLFTLMGISLHIVWLKGLRTKGVPPALTVFAVQLVLNAAWNYFFFGLQSPLLGMIEISVLWVTIAVTIWAFLHISKLAGALLIPYIVWVTIAAAANYYLLVLNL